MSKNSLTAKPADGRQKHTFHTANSETMASWFAACNAGILLERRFRWLCFLSSSLVMCSGKEAKDGSGVWVPTMPVRVWEGVLGSWVSLASPDCHCHLGSERVGRNFLFIPVFQKKNPADSKVYIFTFTLALQTYLLIKRNMSI